MTSEETVITLIVMFMMIVIVFTFNQFLFSSKRDHQAGIARARLLTRMLTVLFFITAIVITQDLELSPGMRLMDTLIFSASAAVFLVLTIQQMVKQARIRHVEKNTPTTDHASR